jgi:predicted dehydrogenase
MSASICRWGILGTANIARKNWKAIRLSGNGIITAVASRTLPRAQQFIDECQADTPFDQKPAACGTYEELLKRSDVDAVYIPLPTGIRKDWVIQAAKAGKHILCEKPCGVSVDEVEAMLAACKANNVQFMDGVMFMHSQRLPLMRQTLDDGKTVGAVRRIASQFTFLGDLGWYNIRFSLFAMNYQLPERVSGRVLAEHGTSGAGVPLEFSGELFFPGGQSATFFCSFLTENQQWAHISGTLGSLYLQDFVLPFSGQESAFGANRPIFRVSGCSFKMESHVQHFGIPEASDGGADSQETNMVRTFAKHVLTGSIDANWGEIALKTQKVLNACYLSARRGGELRAV